MSGEPSGDAAHVERAELDALRRRAYGPDADISDDAVAMARLGELEERLRLDRAAAAARAPQHIEAGSGDEAIDEQPLRRLVPAAPAVAPAADITTPHPPGRPALHARQHAALVAVTAVTAGLLGGIAWNQRQNPPAAALAGYAKTPAVANDRRAEGYEAGYEIYMDGLRDEVLSLAGSAGITDRMIREQLRPYGTLYGRTVGAGPTTDGEFCMIVADAPAPSIACISVENAYANPVSIILPAAYEASDDQPFADVGRLVAYTLMPGGGVIAAPVETGTTDRTP